MNSNPLRWGILGTANIARKNWKAILNSGNSTLTAVASRDIERARQFIHGCQLSAPFTSPPRALGSYDELLAASDVDAVYIPLPTGLRKEWVLRAAAARKHVLCEKPCAPSTGDLGEMIDACRSNRVQFLDGVMFMHSRRLVRMREVLDDGQSIGPIKRITSAFSFLAPDEFFESNIRADPKLEPYGCLGDLGWYCIRLALWAQNWEMPRHVEGRILSRLATTGPARSVPTEFSAELFFENNVSASFYCSFLTQDQQWAHISGTKGCLSLPDFVLPFQGNEIGFDVYNTVFGVNGCDFEMRPGLRRVTVDERSNSDPTAQESAMIRNFAEQIRAGHLNDAWPDIALKTQDVMEACLQAASR